MTIQSMLGDSGVCGRCDCFGHLWVPEGLCDDCHLIVSVERDYREDANFAQRIYCAATAADALKLLRVVDPLAGRRERSQSP